MESLPGGCHRGMAHTGPAMAALSRTYPLQLGPAAPAALLEQLHEPMSDRHRVEEHGVEELHELVGHLVVVALPSHGIGGLEKGDEPVADGGQARVVGLPVDRRGEIAVERYRRRVVEL